MYIKVRVKVDSKKEVLVQKSADHFEISVRAPAKQNLANRRVLEIIAREFKLPVAKMRIISGHHSPSKIVSVENEK